MTPATTVETTSSQVSALPLSHASLSGISKGPRRGQGGHGGARSQRHPPGRREVLGRPGTCLSPGDVYRSHLAHRAGGFRAWIAEFLFAVGEGRAR